MTDLTPELLSALHRRYRDRPDRLAEVVAAAEAWEDLRSSAWQMGVFVDGRWERGDA